MQRFVDDDAGYLQWLVAHPDGFVINTERNPRQGTSCCTVPAVQRSAAPAHGAQWTHDYIKVCGNRNELEEFATHDVAGAAQPCVLCL